MNHELTVGVLGGMGPEATIDFMSSIIALTPAQRDQDHLRMLVEHNPKVPNRQAAIRGDGPAPGQELAAMAERLERAGADFLVMPCNSAHAFLDSIRAATRLPFVSIIDESIREACRVCPAGERIGILATDGLLDAGIYQSATVQAGRIPILPRDGELARLMEMIKRIKAGEKGGSIGDEMNALADSLASSGASVVIAACTEIPLVLRAGNVSVPVISSTEVLARRTVEIALSGTTAGIV